jgi:tetratricopeptide (TPR) repeat protein
MKIRFFSAIIFAGWTLATGLASGQAKRPSVPAAPAATSPQTSSSTPDTAQRADAYYNFAMGHLYEQQYETSNKSEDANLAIDFYKKAYAIDPNNSVIGEELASMYFVAQRTRDAVDEVQAMLKRDPSDLPARRLLARIYIHSLGDLSNAADQSHTVQLAIEQLTEIVRLDPTDEDSIIWLARLDRLNNQNDLAETQLRALLQRDADNEAAVAQLSQLLLDENRSGEAVALLQDTLKQGPSAGLYDQLGDAYTQMGDPTHAAQAYRQAVELEPDEPAHLQGLAQSLFDLGDFDGAVDSYQKLVAMSPNDPTNYLRLSTAYRRMNQLDKAEQQVLLAKQHAPGSLEVIYDEAQIYQDEGRFDDGIRVLTDAVAATKSQTDVTPARRRTLAILYQLLGQIYNDDDKTAAAVSSLQEMGKLGPEEDRRARWLIVDAYRTARDLPHAFDAASDALKTYPDDRPLRISQALLYGENNQPDQGADVLKPLLGDSGAANLEIYLDLAQIYEEGRRYDDAEKALHSAEGVVTRAADRESIGFLFGAVYEHEKKYDQAEQSFKGVLAIDPRNAETLNYYGYMLADRGLRLDEAAGMIQRALDEDPTNGAYLDSIGWAYYKENKLADAEVYLRRAVVREPHNATLHDHLGDILAKSGKTEQATMEWENSLAEWRRAAPAEFEADKVTELQQKISAAKRDPEIKPETKPDAKPETKRAGEAKP